MVVSYLKKMQNEFLQERDRIHNSLYDLEIQLKENQRFIALLEESDDPYFDAFSPRQIHLYQKKKLQDLHDEKKEILVLINEKKEELEKMDVKLNELEQVLKIAEKEY